MEQAAVADQTFWACKLAAIYDAGLQTTPDKQKALRLYKQCLPSSPTTAIRIGEMHELGLGITTDYERALHYYILATTANMSLAPTLFPFSWHEGWHADAEYRIGRLYAQGKGVPQNYTEAAGWFLRAAEYGKQYGNISEARGGNETRARCALAIMYEWNLGVLQNSSTARFWLDKPGVRTNTTCREWETK